MPHLCSLRHQGLWKRRTSVVAPCCISHSLLGWQVIIGPVVGPSPRVHCQMQQGVWSKQGINMQMGREEEGGAWKARV